MSLRAVVIGDSVAWGQGLRHSEKFASLVYEQLTGEQLPETNVLARSGAIIGPTEIQPDDEQTVLAETETNPDHDPRTATDDPWVIQEVPFKVPTVRKQLADITDPDTVDLLFLDGGANDVGLDFVASPASWQDDLEDAIHEHCYNRLTDLLPEAQAQCPNATLVVNGYYPAVTGDTPITALGGGLGGVLGGVGIGAVALLGFGPIGLLLAPVAALPAVAGVAAVGASAAERARRNVLYFHRRMLYWMRKAVAEVNADRSTLDNRIVFAHAGFRHRNGLYADEPWVFAPGDDDPRRADRRPVCRRLYDEGLDRSLCENASMIHPNQAGARAYAEQIVDRYEEGQRRSLHDRLSELTARDALSCRDTLERYNLPVETGLQTCLDHHVVDTVQVTIRTGDNGTDSDVYFRVSEDHQWLLDRTIADDPGGFDDFEAGATDSYMIDPVLDSDGEFLHLPDIEELTLFKRGLFDWRPAHIAVELNGIEVFAAEIEQTLRGDDSWSGAYPRDLLITDIAADAPGVPEAAHLTDEYVTISNASTRDRELTGYLLDYSDGQRFRFPSGFVLEPGDAVTVRTGLGENTETDLYAGYRWPVLNNEGDVVTLRNATGDTVAQRAYGLMA